MEQQEEELSGDVDFVGVGIYANFDLEQGRVVVISTFPDSAAEHAGIKSHDTILTADGLPVLDVEESTSRSQYTRAKLRGQEGNIPDRRSRSQNLC